MSKAFIDTDIYHPSPLDFHNDNTNSIQMLSKALNLKDVCSSDSDMLPPPTHCSQQHLWDCGLACVQMVVRWVMRIQQSPCTMPISSYLDLELVQQKWMREYVATQSIWTIDLLALLHSIFDSNFIIPSKATQSYFPLRNKLSPDSFQSQSAGVKVSIVLCSDHFGVRDSYGACEYYRDQLEEDAVRVGHLFNVAHHFGCKMFLTAPELYNTSKSKTQCLDFPTTTLVHFISRPDCVAIALVDQSLWTPSSSSDDSNTNNRLYSSQPMYYLDDSKNFTYTGHYVLLVGITYACDNHDNHQTRYHHCEVNSKSQYPYYLLVRDPAIDQERETIVSVEWFEKCWKSNGTDSDVILISVDSYSSTSL